MTFNSKNEKGIALLISLGMLSLLLVIVVSFIFTARIDLMVSSFHVDDAATKRFSADSNVLTLFPLQAGGEKASKIQQLKSAGKNTEDWPLAYDYTSDKIIHDGNPDWSRGGISKFEDKKDGQAIAFNLGFTATPEVDDIYSTSLSANGKNNLAWWNDFGRNSDTDLDNSKIALQDEVQTGRDRIAGNIASQNTFITGRYMYFMVDESIKFDLNGILYNRDHDLLHSNFYDIETMFDKLNLDKGALSKGLSDLPELNGEPRFWESWRHIWNEGLFAKDHKYPKPAEERNARDAYNLFTPYSFPTGEFMHYIPKNLNNDWTERRFIHRYFVGNLTKEKNVETLIQAPETYQQQYDFFDTSKFRKGDGQQAAAVLEQVIDREKNNNKNNIYINKNVDFIPWLAHISGSLDNKNAQYSKQLQKQVAANLIDYSDSDSRALTDYTDIETTDKIEYCGLEETPYIAGVNITVKFTPSIDADGTQSKTLFKIKEVKAKVQLANIYNKELSADVSFKAILQDAETVITSSTELTSCSQNSTQIVEVKSTELIDTEFKNLDILKFDKLVVEVQTSGALSDVTLLKGFGKGELKNLREGAPHSFLVEFRDPRCNNYLNFAGEVQHRNLYAKTHDSNWVQGDGESFSEITISNDFYPDSENLIDNESNPFKPSTGFIRNAQITTLWELGCIHRGEPWRTINLKSSCKVGQGEKQGGKVAGQYGKIAGGSQLNNNMAWENPSYEYTGKYAMGDAALLNQIKLTEQIETYPCINIFNPNKKYWDFIFKHIFENNQATMNSTFTGVSSKVYPVPSSLTGTDKNALLTAIKKGGDEGIKPKKAGYVKDHLASQIGDKEGIWCVMYDNPGKNKLNYKGGYDKEKADFYAEELIGKLADQVKINFNLYRYVSTYQKLTYMSSVQSQILDDIAQGDDDDPRLNGYVKLELLGESDIRNDSWFKIMGQQKIMTIMKRPKDTGRFEILENTVLESY